MSFSTGTAYIAQGLDYTLPPGTYPVAYETKDGFYYESPNGLRVSSWLTSATRKGGILWKKGYLRPEHFYIRVAFGTAESLHIPTIADRVEVVSKPKRDGS